MTYKSYHDDTTRSSVLRAAANTEDAVAWGRFFDLYAGFVFSVARSKGLSAEDADDVVQNVFVDLSRLLPSFSYDRQKGHFRSYLLGLVNWRIIDKLKSGKRENELKESYANEAKVAHGSGDGTATVELLWRTAALNEALRRLRGDVNEEHFAAFVESTVEGVDTETVMRLHGISRDNLYQIRARLTARLKPLVASVLKEMDAPRRPGTDGTASA